MLRQMIGTALMIIGLVLLIGTIGAMDFAVASRAYVNDFIATIKIVISAVLLLSGGYVKGWFK